MRIARQGSQTLISRRGSAWEPINEHIEQLIFGSEPTPIAGDSAVISPKFSLPYTPRMIIGVGLNFQDTVDDMGWEKPEKPYLFPKLSSSVTGPTDPIVVDQMITRRADWEGELAVVIGAPTRNIRAENAMGSVFGYVSANDISARDLQAADGQWLRGKGLDTFCPLGPWIATKEELPYPHALKIMTKVNGDTVQNGTTGSMIFSIPELISYCSRYFTLAPGDLILTGTPSGSGDFRNPPIALSPGDVVEVEVEGLGRQENLVVSPEEVKQTRS